ncbi:MAG: chorismate mutase [Eubacterium sp.]|nr:chorismate mutase [Eubacterium sp.]
MDDHTKSEYTLSEVREQLDRIDGEMKRLFLERMAMIEQVTRIKAGTGASVRQPEREAAMIARLTEGVEPEFLTEYRTFLERMLEISRDYQQRRLKEM